ncbi:WhiB family transcriptional regulator [Streptomyces boncukensis]|uniref:Transcriptional regulator WhiB n=1 Tax=Streptomyces boncukensis TaxID=2711219 RepID=A0A6G4X369_9ACTN|nr:WhiB family transcriptional regulator [Streptomyces boncukensis]NGO71828.1 WhiB family transcriptional regulator [Streptomyces boncukensis]
MIDAAVPPFLAQLPHGTRTPCHRRPELFVSDAPSAAVTEAARHMCAACPLQQPCADYAIRMREPDGIWGGLTPQERDAARRPPCGTELGWRSHRSRGESCITCREAHRERLRADREQRLAREHRVHGGSLAGYRLELLLGLPTCARCRAVRQQYYAGRPRPQKWYRRAA